MKEYYGNYLGLCINNNDPERRGRVQIFIPHIMPAIFKNWNEVEEDIQILCVGDNLPESLPGYVVEKLKKMLPWAECASPILGDSSPGQLINNNFNQSPVTGGAGDVAPIPGAGFPPNVKIEPGKTPPKTELVSLLSQAATTVYGPGATAVIFSGTASRTQTDRHPEGWAADVYFNDANGNLITGDRLAEVVKFWHDNQLGSTGINADRAMRPGSLHIDLVGGRYGRPLKGGEALWWSYTGEKSAGQLTPAFRAAVSNVSEGKNSYKGGANNFAAFPTSNSFSLDTNQYQFTSLGGQAASYNAQQSPNPFKLNDNDTFVNPTVEAVGGSSGSIASGQAPTLGGIAPASSATGQSTGIQAGKFTVNREDITPAGPRQQRAVSSYGSVWLDLTSYFDVRPEQRPQSATQYWQSRGIDTNNPARYGYTFGSPLDLQNTGTGSGATFSRGNLTPGFSIGVPRSGSYNLPLGSLVYITNNLGQPIGPNGGIFQVADVGGGSLERRNAIDFYYGNDTGFKSYFQSLINNNAVLNVDPVSVKGASLENIKSVIGQQENVALGDLTSTDIAGLANATGGMVMNTDPNGATSTLNINNMAKGVFTYPSAGAVLWVFFREGNPLFPVYFAANYGKREWESAFRQGSDAPGHKPSPTQDNPVISTGTRIHWGVAGIDVQNTTDPTNPTNNQRSVMLYGHDGSNMFINEGYHQIYSKFDRRDQVDGSRFQSTMGPKEEIVQSDSNSIVMGDRIIKVGNISPDAVNAMNRIHDIIKEIMKPLSESDGPQVKPFPSIPASGKGAKYVRDAINRSKQQYKVPEPIPYTIPAKDILDRFDPNFQPPQPPEISAINEIPITPPTPPAE